MSKQTKLVVNDDGTITFPLRDREALTLTEPSMKQMAEMTRIVVAADASLGDVDQGLMAEARSGTATPELLDKLNVVLRDRNAAMYGDTSPHGAAMLAVVNMLTASDPPITEDDLYAWAMNPIVLRTIREAFTDPLGGQEPETT